MEQDLTQFIEELKAVTEDKEGRSFSTAELAARFPGTALSARQLLLISNYLISMGIDITDYEELKKRADQEETGRSAVQPEMQPSLDEQTWMQPYLEMAENALKPDEAEEKRLLALAGRGDENASEILLGVYMQMLLDLCGQLQVSDESLRADLVPEAVVYLMQEIRAYDPEHTISFRESAQQQIRGKLAAYIRENDMNDSVSAELMDKLNKARSAYQKLGAFLEREPSEEEIAKEIGISAARLRELQEALPQGTAVYTDFPENFDQADEGEDGQPEEYLLTEQILKSVSGLPVLEQECFIAYYGLDGTTPRRANDIAMQYGITEEAVKQCISHALEQMRAAGLDTDFFEV